MISISKLNGADFIVHKYCDSLTKLKTDKELLGVEMGIAYGGTLEKCARAWKGKGRFWGFDTFEGHPKHIVPKEEVFEADCMDVWYDDKIFGRDKLSYEYQRKEFDKQGLDNVTLVKGLVTRHSCDNIPYLNYAFLDMDIYESMKEGYLAVKDKILPGFVMFLHDVTPPNHIPRLFHFLYDEILVGDEGLWTVVGEWTNAYLVGLKRNEAN